MRHGSALFNFAILIFLSATQTAFAQIELAARLERTLFLLYEPIHAEVSVTNKAGYDLVLDGSGLRPWLSFIILRPDNSSVRPDQSFEFSPVELAAGETRTFRVNITPLYAIRDTGSYRLKAVVSVGGVEFVTQPIEFSIANGHTIWKEKRPVEGSERTYSLIRFNYNMEATGLYLRVEDEKENVVYVTHPIGEIVDFTAPRTAFDEQGRLHILHVIGRGLHRYTVASPVGAILNRDEYQSVGDFSPSLVKLKDGSVNVLGARPRPPNRRERLSEAQLLLAESSASEPSGEFSKDKIATKELPATTASADDSPKQRRQQAVRDTALPEGGLF